MVSPSRALPIFAMWTALTTLTGCREGALAERRRQLEEKLAAQ